MDGLPGADYDETQTNFESSMICTLDEYAYDIVYPPLRLSLFFVSESGDSGNFTARRRGRGAWPSLTCRSARENTMKHSTRFGAVLALTMIAAQAHAADVHWSYHGEQGPEHWGDRSPAFARCKTGQEQSPVDLYDAKDALLRPLAPQWLNAPIDITNNGHTVQHSIDNGSTLQIDGQTYTLAQYHLHSPSEHTVDGASYPLEIHFVHENAAGQLAVLGVFVREGDENPALASLLKYAPKTAGSVKVANVSIDPTALLPTPTLTSYFRYAGSLTTPPCSEGVKWHVAKSRITASRAQIDAFRALFHGLNARPVQPLFQRVIEEND